MSAYDKPVERLTPARNADTGFLLAMETAEGMTGILKTASKA